MTTSSLRIIGGQWKRRILTFIVVDDLRPTPDRVRETLFNWLQFEIQGKRCLDAFAGSGALGVEALSRNAAECVFIEKHAGQAKQLQQTLTDFGKPMPVLVGDTLQLLNQQKTPFDVIFLDPPYALNFWQPVCELLVKQQLIHADSWIYIEADRDWSALGLPVAWQAIKNTRAGSVHGFLVRYIPVETL
ncbi:16S rRNA (guanine(966)-N(2))-methyltransferase RsmD [Moraxellaceae bacterium AER2_44_116]|nr:16S rRNA (guanine(966)-N(2))-methyltransferase RsmD [Moraxellaceae bacterium]TQC96852.1 16S rRNA (guanine(966)-N(2))-methyltransferase RsmD [Moraxellaceae bacterium AER2_44_116]